MSWIVSALMILAGLLGSLWGLRSMRLGDPFLMDALRFLVFVGGAFLAAGGVTIIVASFGP